MKKELSKIIIFIGFIVVLLGVILDVLALDSFTASAIISSSTSLSYIAVALATCFVFAKNKTLQNVGFSLAALEGIIGLLNILVSEVLSFVSVGKAIMFVACIIQLLVICLTFFGYSKGKTKTETQDVAVLLNSYKEMQNEKVITEEEYISLKQATLSSINNDNPTLTDLRKWKKLLDQSVITEEEFANLKSKIFNK